MQIRLEITDVELRKLQQDYAERPESQKRRGCLSFEEWAGRKLAYHFSQARWQKGEQAVQETLRPVFTQEIQRRFWEMLSVPQAPESAQSAADKAQDNPATPNTGVEGKDEEDRFSKVVFTVEALVPDFDEVTEADLLGEDACVASGPHTYNRIAGGICGEITAVTIHGPFKGLCPGVLKLEL